MKIQSKKVKERYIVGYKIRTSNEKERDISQAQIPKIVEKFYRDNPLNHLENKLDSSTIYAIYTNYESDKNGEYDYIIGTEVTKISHIPSPLVGITIPAKEYTILTTDRGPLPGNLISAWQYIWEREVSDPQFRRAYTLDFEIYDERAKNPNDVEIDIYIAIK